MHYCFMDRIAKVIKAQAVRTSPSMVSLTVGSYKLSEVMTWHKDSQKCFSGLRNVRGMMNGTNCGSVRP